MGVTSLLPIIILPLIGVLGSSSVSSIYFSDGVVVFWGSMIMATAIEKYNLHKRFARLFLGKSNRSNHSVILLVFICTTGISKDYIYKNIYQ
jgi:sodium-dependent dicarboxylate transporter 2/3/5